MQCAGFTAQNFGFFHGFVLLSLPGPKYQWRPVTGQAATGTPNIQGDAAWILRVASGFPQNWAFSSSILPMCSRSWV